MGGAYSLRHLGMISTSGSWRRYWLPLMWDAWEKSGVFRCDRSDYFIGPNG